MISLIDQKIANNIKGNEEKASKFQENTKIDVSTIEVTSSLFIEYLWLSRSSLGRITANKEIGNRILKSHKCNDFDQYLKDLRELQEDLMSKAYEVIDSKKILESNYLTRQLEKLNEYSKTEIGKKLYQKVKEIYESDVDLSAVRNQIMSDMVLTADLQPLVSLHFEKDMFIFIKNIFDDMNGKFSVSKVSRRVFLSMCGDNFIGDDSDLSQLQKDNIKHFKDDIRRISDKVNFKNNSDLFDAEIVQYSVWGYDGKPARCYTCDSKSKIYFRIAVFNLVMFFLNETRADFGYHKIEPIIGEVVILNDEYSIVDTIKPNHLYSLNDYMSDF